MPSRLRLGAIEFINSLPIGLGFSRQPEAAETELFRASPAVLNEKILAGELDLSPVSALFYAEHQKEFLVLPDLSISSEGAAQSVLLFSRADFKNLKNHTITVTMKGRTTPALLEILCRLRYGFKPDFRFVNGFSPAVTVKSSEATLLIGDDALVAREEFTGTRYKIFDLASEWRDWTGLPLVFALWVARKSYFYSNSDAVVAAHKALIQSKKWGIEHLEEVVAASAEKVNLSKETLASYFSCLSYDFNENLKSGMEAYFQKAVECGILKGVNPVEFAVADKAEIAATAEASG